MSRLAKLQLIGPIILFAAVLMAETAVYALANFPKSEVLWYINLKVFGFFQQSYYLLDCHTGMPHFELFFIVLPMLLMGYIGVIAGHRLLLAISSNLTFVFAGFLAYSWFLSQHHVMQASLTAIAVPRGPDGYLVGVLLSASLVSACVSHFIYARSARIGC